MDKFNDDFDDWMEEHLASAGLSQAPPPPPPVAEASAPAAGAAENEPKREDPWVKQDPWGGTSSDRVRSTSTYQTENSKENVQSVPTANTESHL